MNLKIKTLYFLVVPVTRYVFPRLAELERLGLLDTPQGQTGCIWLRQRHHDHSRSLRIQSSTTTRYAGGS